MPVLTISPPPPTPRWSQGPRERGELVRQLHVGLWGSLWMLNQPVAPTVLKNSPLSRGASLRPAPLGRFSDLGGLSCPALPQAQIRGGRVPIALG